MPVLSTTKLTARRFLPLQDPPGAHLELINGEIAVSPSPTPRHSEIDTLLRTMLNLHVRQHDLGKIYGDVDTVLDDHNVRRPDILFIRKDRLHIVGQMAIEGPPDLCIEILSPSSATVDMVDKFDLYQRHGVPHYWLVDPRTRTLETYVLKDQRYELAAKGRDADTLHLPPFADLAISLGQLWPEE